MKSWADGALLRWTKGVITSPEDVVEPPPPPPSPIDTPKVNTAKKESEWMDTRDERIVELKKKEIALEEFCLACGSKSILTEEHPLFVGGLCEVCRIEYLETAYMFADDGYQCYCCICAEGKELVLCENKGCYRSFCLTCVKLLIAKNEPNKVMSQDPWICYMCQPGETFGFLKIREDWPSRLHKLFSRDQDLEFGPLRSWSPKPLSQRKPIRVLSLFDGIGTGMFVLRELGFVVDVYVASEINSDAIKVSSVRQKGTITHVGDIRGITAKQLRELGPFDLLIGGSPCNDLSIVNPARKGIYGKPSAALVDSPLKLQDCLEQHCNREAKFSKIRTITTKANSIRQQKEAVLPVQMDGKEDGLWCTELERLFGFPDHYTDVCNLSSTGRQKLLGQCWSVPVIYHLLAPLKDYFQCE
ncbi:putative DNA (cytosine-5)-methyltransferase 3B isoform X8 [Apostichopus japonicus]|uniref:DNA (cytosine-5-)-methyltransferase n=1 Tax=Stichopus japonicus TaxID=307972 RepID=A0A2G8JRA7_STIJA|nr:putative DNA (cytosine-5)-methyltransferase 3B isoform X8 [Apostichopus japonicus]